MIDKFVTEASNLQEGGTEWSPRGQVRNTMATSRDEVKHSGPNDALTTPKENAGASVSKVSFRSDVAPAPNDSTADK